MTHSIPLGVIAQHGVEVRQQLAHAGDDRHFLWLARGDQPCMKRGDDWVVPNCRQCGHVDHGAHIAASAPNPAFATTVTRVVGEWRYPNELGDLPPSEPSQFRQRCGQRQDRHRPHALDAVEQFALALEVSVHVVVDVRVEQRTGASARTRG